MFYLIVLSSLPLQTQPLLVMLKKSRSPLVVTTGVRSTHGQISPIHMALKYVKFHFTAIHFSSV